MAPLEGYRKFGLAGLLIAAAVYEKQWQVALVALGIYSVANVIQSFNPKYREEEEDAG